MQRKIVGYHQDEEQQWVADLECGHTQHVRHNPPWTNRPWVVSSAGRRSRLGYPLECKTCDAPPGQTLPEEVTRRLAEVDWERWQPRQHATLLFVIRAGQVLLIYKKRGLGAGKINGPGGRLEPGEAPLHGAVREVQEELEVTPTGVQACGELAFQFVDGLTIFVHVFTAQDCDGTPQETAEAVPLWVPLSQIPFERMWADDRLWFPLMLAGKRFSGRFLFDGDTLLDQHLDWS